MRVKMYYRKDLDEMRVFDKVREQSVVYIQGYSKKYPMYINQSPSLEILVLLSVRYPEIKEVL